MSGHKKNDSTCDSTALLRGQSHSRESSGASNLSVKYTITSDGSGGSPEASATVSTTTTPLKSGAAPAKTKPADTAVKAAAADDSGSGVQRSPRARKKRIRKREKGENDDNANSGNEEDVVVVCVGGTGAGEKENNGRVANHHHNSSCDSIDTPHNNDGMLQTGESKSQNSDYGSFCNTPSDNYLHHHPHPHQNHPSNPSNPAADSINASSSIMASGTATSPSSTAAAGAKTAAAYSSSTTSSKAAVTGAAKVGGGGVDELDRSVMATEYHQQQPLLDNSPDSDSSCSDDDAGANSSGYTRRKTRTLRGNVGGSACIEMPPGGGGGEGEDNGGGVMGEGEGGELAEADVHIPGEPVKTLLAFIILFFGWVASTTALALTHDYVPDGPPLPDVILDRVDKILPQQNWGLEASEIIIMISTLTAFTVCIFHKHRCVVLRRVFVMVAFHYYYRAITMWITKLPVASTEYQCAPKLNSSEIDAAVIAKRVLKLLSGFGLSINGKHVYCGDYIYSGHTMTLIMGYLVIRAYSPKRNGWYLLHYASFCLSVAGVVFLLLARGHYSVDVVIAYWITTRIWWIYHTMCNNGNLLKDHRNKRNYLRKMWWWKLFQYFETNVPIAVPREYNLPIPAKVMRSKPILYITRLCGGGGGGGNHTDSLSDDEAVTTTSSSTRNRRPRNSDLEAGGGSGGRAAISQRP